MPCATIHMLTAGRVLRAWDRRPRRAPFPVERPELRRAFLHGAMGPDMGFVPGVDRLPSELAHYVSSGDLARAIFREANSPAEAAYAWGWATHHLTDVEIHPLVGRACGERLLGDRSVRLNSSDDLQTHVAVEVGLDLVFLDEPGIPRPPQARDSGVGDMAFLARALERTYRIPWDPDSLGRAHRTAVARTARWPALLSELGRLRRFGRYGASGLGPRSLIRPLLSTVARLIPVGTAAAGFLAPQAPPRWLVRRVREVARAFPDRFQEEVEAGLEGLENRNLETGRCERSDVHHPDSERTLRTLRRLQGVAGGEPGSAPQGSASGVTALRRSSAPRRPRILPGPGPGAPAGRLR